LDPVDLEVHPLPQPSRGREDRDLRSGRSIVVDDKAADEERSRLLRRLIDIELDLQLSALTGD